MYKFFRYKIIILGLIILINMAQNAYANGAQINKFKAIYIHKIISNYVKWPDIKMRDNLLLCIFGDKKYYGYFNQISSKRIAELPIIKVSYNMNINYKTKCNVIYIPYENKHKAEKLLKKIRKLPILTIGEKSMVWHGSLITMNKVRGKIRFSVNMNHLKDSKLKIDPRILELSHKVYD